MDHFGLRNLDELPNVMELRKVRLPGCGEHRRATCCFA